jgi:hypothetical protein
VVRERRARISLITGEPETLLLIVTAPAEATPKPEPERRATPVVAAESAVRQKTHRDYLYQRWRPRRVRALLP